MSYYNLCRCIRRLQNITIGLMTGKQQKFTAKKYNFSSSNLKWWISMQNRQQILHPINQKRRKLNKIWKVKTMKRKKSRKNQSNRNRKSQIQIIQKRAQLTRKNLLHNHKKIPILNQINKKWVSHKLIIKPRLLEILPPKRTQSSIMKKKWLTLKRINLWIKLANQIIKVLEEVRAESQCF